MRVAIPDETRQLIEQLKVWGDFSSIAERLLATDIENLPENKKKEIIRAKIPDVAYAVKTGKGDVDVVKEIINYYNEKNVIVSGINSIANVKAAS